MLSRTNRFRVNKPILGVVRRAEGREMAAAASHFICRLIASLCGGEYLQSVADCYALGDPRIIELAA